MSLINQQIEAAILVAMNAHAGQIDRGGNPYILHRRKVLIDEGRVHLAEPL